MTRVQWMWRMGTNIWKRYSKRRGRSELELEETGGMEDLWGTVVGYDRMEDERHLGKDRWRRIHGGRWGKQEKGGKVKEKEDSKHVEGGEKMRGDKEKAPVFYFFSLGESPEALTCTGYTHKHTRTQTHTHTLNVSWLPLARLHLSIKTEMVVLCTVTVCVCVCVCVGKG